MFYKMVSKIYPKHLSSVLRRKKSHKQNLNNPKPKKYKHETTWEESYKAKIREEVESEYIDCEIKNIVYVTLGSKRNAMQNSLKQKFKGMSVVSINL